MSRTTKKITFEEALTKHFSSRARLRPLWKSEHGRCPFAAHRFLAVARKWAGNVAASAMIT